MKKDYTKNNNLTQSNLNQFKNCHKRNTKIKKI